MFYAIGHIAGAGMMHRIASGLGLTLIYLIRRLVTYLFVNPACSSGSAVFAGDWGLAQLWHFRIARILDAMVAGIEHHKSSQLRTRSNWLSILFSIAAFHLDFGDTITKFVVEESMPCFEPRW